MGPKGEGGSLGHCPGAGVSQGIVQRVSNRSNFESKRIHSFKTVHLRQILLAKVTKGFLKVKVILISETFGKIDRSVISIYH